MISNPSRYTRKPGTIASRAASSLATSAAHLTSTPNRGSSGLRWDKAVNILFLFSNDCNEIINIMMAKMKAGSEVRILRRLWGHMIVP
jgi:hypothetical protein